MTDWYNALFTYPCIALSQSTFDVAICLQSDGRYFWRIFLPNDELREGYSATWDGAAADATAKAAELGVSVDKAE